MSTAGLWILLSESYRGGSLQPSVP